MSGITRKIAALLLALAMIVTFTPLYGLSTVAYAEDEEISTEQGAPEEEAGAGDELSGEEDEGDIVAPDEEEPVNEEPAVENSGDDEEEIEEDAAEEDLPAMKEAAGDDEDDVDDGDDPFAGVYMTSLDRIAPDQDWFFTDGYATFQLTDESALNVDGVESYVPYVSAGPDNWNLEIDPSCYTWDPDEMTIVLDGAKIAAKSEYDDIWKITVQIKGFGPDAGPNDEDLRMLATSDVIKFYSTYYGYERDLPGDRSVLPGWDGTFNDVYDITAEDTAHPYEGETIPISIKDVQVKEGRDLLEDWHPDHDDNHSWWYYRAGREPGTVVFEITYTDHEGRDQTYESALLICGDVYESNMWTDGNVFMGLPGSSIYLNAGAGHKYVNEQGDEQYTEDGLDYVWSFDSYNADKYATLTVDENDHSRATLTFKEVEDGDYNEVGCRVKVTIVDTESDDPGIERSSQNRWFSLRDEYRMIWPSELNPGLNVGQTIEDQQFELRHYKYGGTGEEGYNDEGFKLETINKVRWDFDSNAFRITRAGGGNVSNGTTYESCDTFSFTRKGDWNTRMNLTVNEGEDNQTDAEYWFFNRDYELWFDRDDIEVYSDTEEDPQFRIDTGNFGNGEDADDDFIFTVTAGEWDRDNWISKIPRADYTVVRDGNELVVTFDREALFPDGADWNRDIRVEVEAESKTADFSRSRDAWMHLREARYEFDQDEYMEMFPGEDRSFDRLHVWIQNTEYPDGADFDYEILNVEVTSGEEFLEEEELPTEDNGWRFRAKDYGQVNFVITYRDEHDNEQTYNVEVNIVGDIYEAWLRFYEPYNSFLPGTTVELEAEGIHRYVEQNGWISEDREGLDYEWSFMCGGEYATITPDPQDPSRATLKMKDLPPGSNFINENVQVKVEVKDPQSDDPQAERASDWLDFYVRSEFEVIWPERIGDPLDLGATSDDMQFEVRRYSAFGSLADGYNDEGFKTYAIETARWNYDEDVLTITTPDGETVQNDETVNCDTFRFTRNREWNHEPDLSVTYRDDNGDEQEMNWRFWLEDLHYNLWFDEGEVSVYDDGQWTVNLEKEDWLDYSNLDIRYSAGYWDDEDNWVEVQDEVWELSANGQSVTIFGEKMRELGVDGFDIVAEAYYGEGDEAWRVNGDSNGCWVRLEESCISRGEEHLWLSAPPEYKDCTSKGWQKQMCWNCHERRVVEVAPRGHIATTVKAKAATATKEGNVQYWKCSACGKLFSDAKCTKTTTADSRIIPKGVAGLKLTAQKKGFTAKWTKPTGNFLKHTTGYEVMYALDKNFKKSVKTLTVTNNGTVSKKVTKLKAKKKYFVKVRAYRLIDGKKQYSPWSAVMKVTTKK